QICKTWLEQLKSGKIICRQIPGCSWNSKGVAIGPGYHLCSLNIFSLMMILPRVQVSCALLKHCGTTAGIVRVGYGWKRKCFFTAHWVNAPYLGFDLPSGSLINVILSEAKNPAISILESFITQKHRTFLHHSEVAGCFAVLLMALFVSLS